MTGAPASDRRGGVAARRARLSLWPRLALACAAVALACAGTATARGAAPTVDYLYPAGGRQGSTVTFTVGAAKGDAKIDPWPAAVWTDAPGVKIEPGEKNGTFVATIADDAAPGARLVRFHNADGTSAPKVFVVGHRSEEQQEKESASKDPNDDARAAQPAGRLPAVLNGRLEKAGDVDAWAVDVEAGRWLVADLACRRLGSPIDPSLHLLDPDGTVVAFAHDTFGLDPLLAYRVERSGRYVLQIAGFAHPPAADVRYAGSKANVYRLSVTTGPYARAAFPACVARGGRTPVRLFGWNLGDADGDGLVVDVDASAAAADAERVTLAGPQVDNVLRLALTGQPGKPESEPNDGADAPQPVDVPAGIDGRLDRPGDVDRFAVQAKKGDKLVATVRAAGLGSPIDPVLTVSDAGGKQVARVDDDEAKGRDAPASWTAPADGTYVVALADLARGGGPECVYRLDVTRAGAAFTATADKDAYRVEPGKSVDLKLTVTRQVGDDAPLGVSVTNLPDGVTATTPDVPAKGGAVTVTLKAAADAKPASQPFRTRIVSKDEKRPADRLAAYAIGQDQMIENTVALWLTVAPAAKGK